MSCSIQFGEARDDFKKGLLTKFQIWNIPVNGGLVVRVVTTYEGWKDLVDARTGTPRVFKTYDAALSVLRRIGFQADLVEGK